MEEQSIHGQWKCLFSWVSEFRGVLLDSKDLVYTLLLALFSAPEPLLSLKISNVG